MADKFPIENKIANSGLVNFDIATLVPKGKRIGIDFKDYLFQGMILKERDFRDKIITMNIDAYSDAYVYIYNSADAIVPLWAYFLMTAKLNEVAKQIVFGNEKELETILLHEAIERYNFNDLKEKRVLVKGCSEIDIPENAYVELVQKLQPIVKSLMFGEACSNVPILKN